MKNAATSLSPFVLSVIACTSAAPPAPAPPPPELTLASLHVAGTPAENTWTAQNPIQLTLGCANNPLIVELSPAPVQGSIDGFEIAVPGGCSNTASCGWFVLRIDAGEEDEIVIPSRSGWITVDEPLDPGTHTVSIELHDAYDRVFLQSDNTPIGDQISLDLVAPASCQDSDLDAG